MDRYTVFGNPIRQSKSPDIHRQFAQQTKQQLQYDASLADEEGFVDAVMAFRNRGGCGANVTMPFKQQAVALCDQLSERAKRAGAVNTLHWLEDGQLLGDNTDGAGLVSDLLRLGVSLQGKRILVLGAGGAVRGVLAPLMAQAPQQLTIANRTASKAASLASAFADMGEIRGGGFEQISGRFDIIINGTSTSLSGQVPSLPNLTIDADCVSYDMAYGEGDTLFQQWSKGMGIKRSYSGLGMLVGQAAISFELWRGVKPETEQVLHRLLAKMESS